jgi:Uncharacterized protein conserved in bacteria (DUF2332)
MGSDVEAGSDPHGTAAWYGRAAEELSATSALQVEWARGIAADPDVVALIDQLPREHRQPSLLFSVAHYLGAPVAGWDELRPWWIAEWPRLEAAARTRHTQTNEVGRCAPLLAALDRIPGPLALIELGASAGLCLGVERYSYRFDDEPVFGDGQPLLNCTTTGSGAAPAQLPDIAWRRGVDLAPLSLTDSDDVAWLEALLPPDRPERRERLRVATTRLIDDPPDVVQGDALEALPALLAAAPSGATIVVIALGTLVYLPPAARTDVLDTVALAGARMVTLEPVSALPQIESALAGLTAPEPTPFVLAIDGVPIAYSSAHGERMSWLSTVRQPRSEQASP